MVAPLESEAMQGFTSALDRINQLADRSPGFVWRLQDNEGNATAIRPYHDPLIIINMSVWESVETLHAYTYHTDHRLMLKQRRLWFSPTKEELLVLWWIPAGQTPTITEGKKKLALINVLGPTPEAFNFKTHFPAPVG